MEFSAILRHTKHFNLLEICVLGKRRSKLTKTIGIVTSGGDAPGMNAAIRAVTRVGHSMGFQVIGFERGWDGLLTNCFKKLTPRRCRRHNSAWRHHASYLEVPIV